MSWKDVGCENYEEYVLKGLGNAKVEGSTTPQSEQSNHANTLPRRFERLLDDATQGMGDREKVIAYRFARFGLTFAIDAQQDTLLALKNSQPSLLGLRR